MQGTPLFSRHKKTHNILSSILFRSLVSKVALTVGGEHDHQPLKKHRDEHATGKNDDVVVIVYTALAILCLVCVVMLLAHCVRTGPSVRRSAFS